MANSQKRFDCFNLIPFQNYGVHCALGNLHCCRKYFVNRICKTANNRTGFLCDDRATCVLPSAVCNGVSNCYNSEDENPQMCSNLPKNLPAFLIFQCANPLVWIYSNQECDGYNNCGDCSDEVGSLCGSSCPAGWWRCTPVFYQFCWCIPPTFRCDGVQHCNDWSDEINCSP
uniref:Low density lipoprotein receptor class A domain containing 1 n=1 Tax=Erpetoichthys calabaricus TaxID=27687 RepID=A0A8C4S5V9_ERPCA